METLKPIEISEYYINRVTRGLERYFWDNLFGKIFEILKLKKVGPTTGPFRYDPDQITYNFTVEVTNRQGIRYGRQSA